MHERRRTSAVVAGRRQNEEPNVADQQSLLAAGSQTRAKAATATAAATKDKLQPELPSDSNATLHHVFSTTTAATTTTTSSAAAAAADRSDDLPAIDVVHPRVGPSNSSAKAVSGQQGSSVSDVIAVGLAASVAADHGRRNEEAGCLVSRLRTLFLHLKKRTVLFF